MQNIKSILLMTFFILALFGASLFAGNNDTLKGSNIQLEVAGLSCPFCAYGLEKKLKTLDGIDKLDINISNGLIKGTLKEGMTVEKSDLKKQISEAGFTLKKVIVDGKEYPVSQKENDKK